MLISHRGWVHAGVALAVGVLADACTVERDVVATVELTTMDASMVEMPPDAGQKPADPMPCTLAFWYFRLYEIVHDDNCRVSARDPLIALIIDLTKPAMGESSTPSRCEAYGVPFYSDPEDPSQYILCEATCRSSTEAVEAERRRYTACMEAMTPVEP